MLFDYNFIGPESVVHVLFNVHTVNPSKIVCIQNSIADWNAIWSYLIFYIKFFYINPRFPMLRNIFHYLF